MSQSTCIHLYPATDGQQTGNNFVAVNVLLVATCMLTATVPGNMLPWCTRGLTECLLIVEALEGCGCVSGSSDSDNIVVVRTSLGDVRGRVVPVPLGDLSGVTVDQFLGIPYAVPPVGQLRFADPVPLDRLPSGTLTTHHHFSSALQFG